MKKILLQFIFLFCIFQLSAQLSFNPIEVLFDHPREEFSHLNYPFLPFDYDSDGDTDLVGSTFDGINLMKNNGDGTFEDIVLSTDGRRGIRIMDFDNDGDQDLVNTVNFYLYEEQDSFTHVWADLGFPEDIIGVADFNGDGFNDLLSYKNDVFAGQAVKFYINNQDNTFEPFELEVGFEDILDTEIGDMDGDGDADIVVAVEDADVAAVILSNENGTFVPVQTLDQPAAPSRTNLEIADLNGDGIMDILLNRSGRLFVHSEIKTQSIPCRQKWLLRVHYL